MSFISRLKSKEMPVLMPDGDYVPTYPLKDAGYEKEVDAVWEDPAEIKKFTAACAQYREELVVQVASRLGNTASGL